LPLASGSCPFGARDSLPQAGLRSIKPKHDAGVMVPSSAEAEGISMRVALAAAAIVFALGGAAEAKILDKVQVNVGISGVLPDEGAKISAVGGTVDISDEVVPTVSLEYRFTDTLSAELMCCAARHDVKAVQTALGTVDLGEITHFPPTLTLKYRFAGMGPLKPYVGAGVNYTHFFDESLPAGGPVTRIDYDDSVGPALQAGAEYRLNDTWSVFADARKIWINTDVTIDAGATRIKADVDIDPWVVTAGFGYRF
jgi:outer membrane protein